MASDQAGADGITRIVDVGAKAVARVQKMARKGGTRPINRVMAMDSSRKTKT